MTIRTRIIACITSWSSKHTVDARLSCFHQKVSHMKFWGQGCVQTPTSASSLVLPWAGNNVHIAYKAILKRIFKILDWGVRSTLTKNVTSRKHRNWSADLGARWSNRDEISEIQLVMSRQQPSISVLTGSETNFRNSNPKSPFYRDKKRDMIVTLFEENPRFGVRKSDQIGELSPA